MLESLPYNYSNSLRIYSVLHRLLNIVMMQALNLKISIV